MSPSYPTIYKGVREVISEKTGLDPSDIKAPMKLDEPPLSFTPQGKRALAPALSAKFPKPPRKKAITPDATGAAKTVRDLADIVAGAH